MVGSRACVSWVLIDTIHFRIYNLRKHDALVQYLHQKRVDGSSQYVKDIPVEDVPKRVYNSRFWWDWSTGRQVEQRYRGHLPSYHYNIAFSINFASDYIEWNLSIPKFLYRTNVFQFVPHYFDGDYSLVYGNSIEERGKAAYGRLKRFLNAFFKTHCGDQVDWYDVHIVRVDLCFNMLFKSKSEALDYMKELKKIKKKHSRESKVFTDGEYFGLYYVQGDYTFKVYHKGLEFGAAGHDASELKRRGVSKDKIQAMQQFADRMVRYEVEFRTGMMDTVFKRKVFRRNDRKWLKGRKYYFSFSRGGYIKKNGKKLYKVPPVKDDRGREYSKKQIAEMRMSKAQLALVKYGQFYTNKTFHFFLKSDSRLADSDERSLLFWHAEIATGSFTFEPDQKFSKKLWDGMVDQFLVFLREFTVQYQEESRYVLRKVDAMDASDKDKSIEFYEYLRMKTGLEDKVLRRINRNTFRLWLKMLESHTMTDIKNSGIVAERTFYLYKSVFVKLGYSDVAPSRLAAKGDTSFTDYMWEVDNLNAKLNFENLFVSKF